MKHQGIWDAQANIILQCYIQWKTMWGNQHHSTQKREVRQKSPKSQFFVYLGAKITQKPLAGKQRLDLPICARSIPIFACHVSTCSNG